MSFGHSRQFCPLFYNFIYEGSYWRQSFLFFISIHIAVCIIRFFFLFYCKIVSQCMAIPQVFIQFLSSHLLMDIEWLIFHLGFITFSVHERVTLPLFSFLVKVILRYFGSKVILASSVVGKVKQLHVNQ